MTHITLPEITTQSTRTGPRQAVQVQGAINMNPTALLIYLYNTQRQIEWLNQDTQRLQQQVSSLGTVLRGAERPRNVVETLRASMVSSQTDLEAMRTGLTTLGSLRNTLEREYRNHYPDGGSGIPSAAEQQHLDAVSLAGMVMARTGQSVAQAAATLGAPMPQPFLTRPHQVASIMRNNRLLRRYGRSDLESPQTAAECAALVPVQRPPDPPAGGGSCFPGAMASGQSDPAGVRSFRDAFSASWETQARLFATGQPMGNDTNRRRFVFNDGSYVTVQAHVPGLLRSADSEFTGAVLGTAAVITGTLAGGLIGAMAGGFGAAAIPYPNDAAWQGYTIAYFDARPHATPWATRYFYGWKQAKTVGQEVRIPDHNAPGISANFADHTGDFSWWNWKSGTAATEKPAAAERSFSLDKDTQKLIEVMAAGPGRTRRAVLDSHQQTRSNGWLLHGMTSSRQADTSCQEPRLARIA